MTDNHWNKIKSERNILINKDKKRLSQLKNVY